MRKNYERSGDAEFQTLLAVVGGTAVNLLEFVNTLTLYESVDSTFMTGSLVFTDANNVLRGFDLETILTFWDRLEHHFQIKPKTTLKAFSLGTM